MEQWICHPPAGGSNPFTSLKFSFKNNDLKNILSHDWLAECVEELKKLVDQKCQEKLIIV